MLLKGLLLLQVICEICLFCEYSRAKTVSTSYCVAALYLNGFLDFLFLKYEILDFQLRKNCRVAALSTE